MSDSRIISPRPPVAENPAGAAGLRRGLLCLIVVAVLCAVPAPASATHNPAEDYFHLAGNFNLLPGGLPLAYTIPSHNHNFTIGSSTSLEGYPNNLWYPSAAQAPIGETDRCTYFGSGEDIFYKDTLWYQITPPWKAQLHLTVTGQTTGWRPSVSVMPVNLATQLPPYFFPSPGQYRLIGSQCDVAGGNIARLDPPFVVAAGQAYRIQIAGSRSSGVTEGEFQFAYSLDPDREPDGLYDSADACDTERGEAEDGGCPDNDDDDVINSQDQCSSLKGDPRYNGCPDGDRDGNPEGNGLRPDRDHCPNENPALLKRKDGDDNGCADYLEQRPAYNFKPAAHYLVRGRSVGIVVKRLTVSRLRSGAKVSISCRPKRCRSESKKAGRKGTVEFRRLRGKRLRSGTQVTLKVTYPNAITEVRRYKIRPGSTTNRKDYCIQPGSSKLRTKCSPDR